MEVEEQGFLCGVWNVLNLLRAILKLMTSPEKLAWRKTIGPKLQKQASLDYQPKRVVKLQRKMI